MLISQQSEFFQEEEKREVIFDHSSTINTVKCDNSLILIHFLGGTSLCVTLLVERIRVVGMFICNMSKE